VPPWTSCTSGCLRAVVDMSLKDRIGIMVKSASLPRTIWFLWLQGLDEAPYVVRKCYESWGERNPGWRVVLLNRELLANFGSLDYTAGPMAGLSNQQVSDLLRLDLLANHGGVWVDATCFCVQPLDDWLIAKMNSGFFAFDRPGRDRIISSWFLAAEPGNHFVSEMFALMRDYWDHEPVRRDDRNLIVRVLARLLKVSHRTRSWWFSNLLRNRLGASPYFALHYGFEKLVREDRECGEIWRRTPKVSAAGPHRLYAAGLLSQTTHSVRDAIDRREVPVYKITWKFRDASAVPSGSVLAYLLDTSSN
jgi:hypothetical protein